MKAVIIDQFGAPEQLTLRDLPTPETGPGDVLVRIEAAGVNFGDTLMRSGAAGIKLVPPMVLGSEAAGTVEAVGEDVDRTLVGNRVFAAPFAVGRLGGGYASHIVLPAAATVRLPHAVTSEQAIALGVAGITALELADIAPVAGRIVIVHSAAGGVGHLLTQLLASRAPAHLIASVGSPEKAAMLAELGISAVVNTGADWVSQVHELTGGAAPDVIFDAFGGEVSRRGLAALAAGGHFVAYGGASGSYAELSAAATPGLVMSRQSLLGYSMVPLLGRADATEQIRHHFDTLYAATAAGQLKPVVGQRLGLRAAAEAHRLLEGRGTTGKIVLLPDADG